MQNQTITSINLFIHFELILKCAQTACCIASSHKLCTCMMSVMAAQSNSKDGATASFNWRVYPPDRQVEVALSRPLNLNTARIYAGGFSKGGTEPHPRPTRPQTNNSQRGGQITASYNNLTNLLDLVLGCCLRVFSVLCFVCCLGLRTAS